MALRGSGKISSLQNGNYNSTLFAGLSLSSVKCECPFLTRNQRGSNSMLYAISYRIISSDIAKCPSIVIPTNTQTKSEVHPSVPNECSKQTGQSRPNKVNRKHLFNPSNKPDWVSSHYSHLHYDVSCSSSSRPRPSRLFSACWTAN